MASARAGTLDPSVKAQGVATAVALDVVGRATWADGDRILIVAAMGVLEYLAVSHARLLHEALMPHVSNSSTSRSYCLQPRPTSCSAWFARTSRAAFIATATRARPAAGPARCHPPD